MKEKKEPHSQQQKRVVFPEDTPQVIDSILKERDLETIEDIFGKYDLSDPRKRKIFERKWKELPGSKMARIIADFAKGELKNKEEVIEALRKELQASESLAKKLAQDINRDIIDLSQRTIRKKETPQEEKPPSRDPYREPLEE